MFGFDTGGFGLAIIAILAVFAALMLFVIGQTVHQLLADRKSEATGQVADDVARKGSAGAQRGDDAKPAVEVEEESPQERKSYDDDFDDIEWNLD